MNKKTNKTNKTGGCGCGAQTPTSSLFSGGGSKLFSLRNLYGKYIGKTNKNGKKVSTCKRKISKRKTYKTK